MVGGYRVLITGASSGFGRLTAETLARAGHRVFAGMRAPATRSESKELVESAKGAAGSIEVVDLDVTDDASVSRAIARVAELSGGLDVLVNNAGLAALGLVEAFTIEQARELFEVNVMGVIRVNRAALPLLRRQGSGLLIHVSSTVGRYVMPFLGIYTASKYALEALSDAYRFELAPFGVESVLVEPGSFPTRIMTNMLRPSDAARAAEYGALGERVAGLEAGLGAMFASEGAPQPQAVADAIARVIDAPKGSRPARTVVDGQGGALVEDLNRAAEEVQAQILGALGMADLLRVKVREEG